MQQFLSDAQRALAAARSVPVALKRLARAVVPAAADVCLIFLIRGSDVRCVAAAHGTSEGLRVLRSFLRVYRITVADPVSTVAHVVRTGRPRLRGEIHGERTPPLRARPVLALHQRLGLRSALVVPIGTAPRVLGAISLSYAASGRRYAANDVAPAMRLALLAERILTSNRPAVATHVRSLTQRVVRVRGRA